MPVRRYEMTEEQWEQICSLFPIAKTGRPPKDNRLMFNAILWIARSGSAWRDLSERYGSWKRCTAVSVNGEMMEHFSQFFML